MFKTLIGGRGESHQDINHTLITSMSKNLQEGQQCKAVNFSSTDLL